MSDSNPLDVSPDSLLELIQQQRLMTLLDDSADIDKGRLELMRDIARTAMDSKRLNVSEDVAASNQELARSFMSVINEGNMNPFRQKIEKDNGPIIIEMEDLPEFELLPNELSTENANLDYDELFDIKE